MLNETIPPEDYEVFRAFLEEACGITLGDNKDYLVASRLSRLMSECAIGSLRELVTLVKNERNSRLRARVVDAMTTNETFWFRDQHPYEILRQLVLPEVTQRREPQVRIWSAACSSGEEPYSISMVMDEYLATRPGGLPADTQIIATDVAPSMLEQAAAAVYEAKTLARGLSAERIQRYLVPRGPKWAVREDICKRVVFRELNLVRDFRALGRFDAIFCRNVLIYFSAEAKTDILARFEQVLKPRGFLFLGASEAVSNYSSAFEMVRAHGGVVYRLKSHRQL